MKIIKTVVCFILVALCVFNFTFIKDKLKITKSESIETSKKIINIWQIDGFEGGTGSRKSFLTSCGKELEKIDDNILIMVNEYSLNEAQRKIDNNIYPDMISYCNGISINNLVKIDNISSTSGEIGDYCYSVSWCRGCYVLISKEEKFNIDNDSKIIVSDNENICPLFALYENGFFNKNIEYYDSKICYQQFISQKNCLLLGTQRDVIRLKNTEKNFSYKILEGYNDLYQNILISTMDYDKTDICNKFIKILLSENIQNKLTNLNLFSDIVNLDYQDIFSEMQNNNCKNTVSSLLSLNELSLIKQKLSSFSINDVNEYDKFKKMYFKS